MLPRPHQLPTVWSLLRHPYGSRERVLRFRDRQLRRLVRHAYAHVPYYRELFDRSGVRPESIRTAADLVRLPVTRKRDLQERPLEDLLARGTDPARMVVRSTSGSSGRPFVIRRARSEEALLRFVVERIAVYHGFRPTLKHAKVVYPHDDGSRSALGRFFAGMGLYRRLTVDCRLPREEILARLTEFRPDFISGYSGTLARVARLIDPRRRPFRPRAIVAGSEVLTPEMRREMEERFGAPVFDTYGSHEFTRIAYQCRVSGDLHVCDDTVVVEILADGEPVGPGERGEVVATALHSWAMPFIRYSLEDLAVAGDEQCACGQPYSTIRDVQGRVVDFFTRADGRSLHPYELAVAIRDAMEDWSLLEYQLVQETLRRVVLKAVPAKEPTARTIARIEAAALRVLGPGMEFRCDVVPAIPLTPGGKFRTYRSLVEPDGNELSVRANGTEATGFRISGPS